MDNKDNEIKKRKLSNSNMKNKNQTQESNNTHNEGKLESVTENKEKNLLTSQEEKIKKNAGKSSTRKKAAVATAVVLLLIAGVSVPTTVYLSKRKVSVDIENNVDVIQEYTVNVKRGTTIKDIVPQLYLCRFL